MASWQAKTVVSGNPFFSSYLGAGPQNQSSGRWECVLSEGCFRRGHAVPLLSAGWAPRAPLPKPRSPPGGRSARRGERPAAGPSAALGRAAAIAASVCSAFNFPFLVLFPLSAPPPSVRQALSSVGSHLRVNIISYGHNRQE